MRDQSATVLDVANLKTVFNTRDGEVHAVNDVSFYLKPGELLGIVGESGSGKSVTMMSLLKLLPMPPAEIRDGTIDFDGRDLRHMSDNDLRRVRGGEIGFIFQDPMTSLNPVFTVGFQLVEPLRLHMGLNKKQARKRAAELLELVGIPDAANRLKDFPHQFSGGMRQRVMIAMSLLCQPKLLIADEPTTALDVTVQAQIMKLLKDVQDEFGTSIILITHDLGVVAGSTDDTLVMYGGQVMEVASTDDLFAAPTHPYTRGLLKAVPRLDVDEDMLSTIPGNPPNMMIEPKGCPFRDRCENAIAACAETMPPLVPTGDRPGHLRACHVAVEDVK